MITLLNDLLKGGINGGIKLKIDFSSIEIGGNIDLLGIVLMNIALEVKNDVRMAVSISILCMINTNNIL
jgi:hypothetical protein